MGSKNPKQHYQVLVDARVLGYCSDCMDVMKRLGYKLKKVDWRIGKATSWYGLAYYKHNMVVLNQELLKEDEAAVKNTILHELAHLAAPGCKHGRGWQKVCDKIYAATGILITRTNPMMQHESVQAYWKSKVKYEFICPCCGTKLHYTKATRFVREFDQLNAAGEPKWWCTHCRKTSGEKIAFKKMEASYGES